MLDGSGPTVNDDGGSCSDPTGAMFHPRASSPESSWQTLSQSIEWLVARHGIPLELQPRSPPAADSGPFPNWPARNNGTWTSQAHTTLGRVLIPNERPERGRGGGDGMESET